MRAGWITAYWIFLQPPEYAMIRFILCKDLLNEMETFKELIYDLNCCKFWNALHKTSDNFRTEYLFVLKTYQNWIVEKISRIQSEFLKFQSHRRLLRLGDRRISDLI